jgi:hypothetical protein
MSKSDDSVELNKRLGVIIALLLRSLASTKESVPLREQVRILSELGMRPKDIAEILGRTTTYVNKELTVFRKGKKTQQ